ncbi:chlorhexidine efflux transporter, partial [Ramlibacter sp. AN1133]|uniref:chlorhexidine efflux transporter n=1 Tax=Ramlibacter sp. AN1133 TaxID=3133429 RepID=UPI0030C3E6FE
MRSGSFSCLARQLHGDTSTLPCGRNQPATARRDHLRTFFTHMSPITRRVVQAVLYELMAIGFVGPALSVAFDEPQTSTFGLAVVLSSIALTWNYAFNWIFERWESRQIV